MLGPNLAWVARQRAGLPWPPACAGSGLLLIRRVAALYGLRPGLAVTLALLRRVDERAGSFGDQADYRVILGY